MSDRPDICRARADGDGSIRCRPCRLVWDKDDTEPPPCPLAVVSEAMPDPPLPAPSVKPLTLHTLAWLRVISHAPVVRQSINPGVADALERRGYVATTDLASPFKTHRGRLIRHLRITEAGRAHLDETP